MTADLFAMLGIECPDIAEDDGRLLLPTPNARDWKGCTGPGSTYSSLPRAICELTGHELTGDDE